MSNAITRRQALKTMGLTIGATALGLKGFSRKGTDLFEYPLNHRDIYLPVENPLGRPVTAITCGAGSRGNVYGNYAANFPDQIRIIGVAEPIPVRNERYS